ncbi:MAG: hypothetical protein LJU34_00205, partial [Oscillospiraceae bacterium]|nr:hypothetical protein [Oscillospiraceae bacterium]
AYRGCASFVTSSSPRAALPACALPPGPRRARATSGAVKKGRTEGGLYLLEETAREVIEAYRDGGAVDAPDYMTERARLMEIKRKSEEYDLGVKQGQLHRTEDIEAALTKTLVSFRAQIEGIPTKAAPQAAKIKNSTAIFDLLKTMTDEALEVLSDLGDITDAKNGADGGDR